MKKVSIVIPKAPERGICAELFLGLAALCRREERYKLNLDVSEHIPSENARNHAVKEFLESDYDYLLMVDDDNPPRKNPLDLVELDLDVVGCPTPIWHVTEDKVADGVWPLLWNVFDARGEEWTQTLKPRDGLQEVDAVGTGCILIARRVLEGMPRPFERVWHEDGTCWKGSDLYFCQKAKARCFKIWTHWDYYCGHLNQVELTQARAVMSFRDIGHVRRTNPNTPAYWDSQWEKRGERRYPFWPEILELCRGKKVLDFGCGRGDLLDYLKSHGITAVGMDHSEVAVNACRDRGLFSSHGAWPIGRHDVIVCTEVLEHLDDDDGMIEEFFRHAPTVIYTVPANRLPPGIEPEHRRVYTIRDIREITPHLKEVKEIDGYYLVVAEREVRTDGNREGCIPASAGSLD